VSFLPPASSGVPRRFHPKRVPLGSWPEIMREAASIIGAAPVGLSGLFLLLFLPIVLLRELPYLGMPLCIIIGSIGFTGLFLALEAARDGRAPSILDMAAPWRLPAGKLALLAASGLIPFLCVLAIWCIDVGASGVDDLLGGRVAPGAVSEREVMEKILGFDFASMPFYFLQPLCILADWSPSRTMAANLLACLANWRWVLALTLLQVPIEIGIEAFDPDNGLEQVISLLSAVAVGIIFNGVTLCLLRRSLDPHP
jgi:hypothetical protein